MEDNVGFYLKLSIKKKLLNRIYKIHWNHSDSKSVAITPAITRHKT